MSGKNTETSRCHELKKKVAGNHVEKKVTGASKILKSVC